MKAHQRRLIAFTITLLLLTIAIQRLDGQDSTSVQKGISYTAWGAGQYAQADADLSLANLASNGADWIGLIVVGFQDTIRSTTIFTTTATATDADLIHVIAEAHSLGLRVMLKPHLGLLNDPSHWRGQIGEAFTTQAEWEAWFASYRTYIEHYADLAETYGADQFCAGTELIGTTYRSDDWRAVVGGIRARYSGPIIYASNHSGEETSVTWWDAVDYIGVDAYYELTDKNDPTLDELKSAWKPHIAILADLAATWEKPIVLTEIGYRSQDGANQRPWDWQSEGTVDLEEQVDAYRATFESFWDQPWFAGMFWWEWNTDPFQGGPCDNAYTPHDKPAEDVLRAWYGAPPRPILPTLQPDYSHAMDIYTDGLGPSWEDWSWGAARNLAATDQAYDGTQAISVTLEGWGALSFWHPAFDSGPYYWLECYVRGSSSGEQHLWVFFYDVDGTELRRRPVNDCRYTEEEGLEVGSWKRIRIPLSDLNAPEQRLGRIAIQDRSGRESTAFWVDEIRLVGAARPVYLPLIIKEQHTSTTTAAW
jgi:hypothetical protein